MRFADVRGRCVIATQACSGVLRFTCCRAIAMPQNQWLAGAGHGIRFAIVVRESAKYSTCPLLQRAGAGITGPKTTCFREPGVDKGRLVIRRLMGCSRRGFFCKWALYSWIGSNIRAFSAQILTASAERPEFSPDLISECARRDQLWAPMRRAPVPAITVSIYRLKSPRQSSEL
jgi:hypothetical protein